MKKKLPTKPKAEQPDERAPEYRFAYRKANRIDSLSGHGRDPLQFFWTDVAQFFKTGRAVNAVLRTLMTTMPKRRRPSHR